MSTCKRRKPLCAFCALSLLIFGRAAAAQSGQQNSQQPVEGWIPISSAGANNSTLVTPTMPRMPSVSTPSIGGGFYVPGSDGFYAPTLPRKNTTSSSTGADGTKSGAGTATSGAAASTGAATQNTTAPKSPTLQTNQNAATLQNLSLAASTQSANQLSSILSAGDLNSLQSSGLIGSFSSLLGVNNSKLTQAAGSSTLSADSLMLQQILNELTSIKQEVAARKESAAASGQGGAEAVSATIPASASPRILRFLVNGHDVLPSCRQLYFSTQESDGSFLLTGDRKYAADGKLRAETFYLLFRATGSKSGTTSYNVALSLSQDYLNENSFLYQLSKHGSLQATRTGNLVTMHISDAGWNCDLLLTMDN
ncbi:MAG: hypothetical protein K6G80_03185 [Treponema sp.]|nr:hypothetical protein [Treponema sp.]